MWIPSDRLGLRHEKRSEKVRMRDKFKNTSFAILVRACNLHPFLAQLVLVFRIQTEVAIELLHQSRGSTGNSGFPSRFDVDLHRRSNQRATEGSDEEARRVRVRLCVGRIRETQHIPGELDRKVLEPSTGANEWNVVFTCVSNGSQRSVKTSVWAAGAAKQSLECSKLLRLMSG